MLLAVPPSPFPPSFHLYPSLVDRIHILFFILFVAGFCLATIAIRLIVGDTIDAQDASALSHERDSIHIYSNSWGPSDGGYVVMGPATLATQALMEGAQQVRIIL